MRSPRAAGVTVLVIAGIAALALLGLLLHEWWNSGPSADAKKLTALYEQRVPLPEADNAWLDLYGFGAPEGVDVREFGARRIAWMARALNHPDPETLGKDPGDSYTDIETARSPEMKRIFEACLRRPGLACGEAMKLNVDGVALSSLEPLFKPRYLAMQNRAGIFTTVEYDPSQPLPGYTAVMETQRLTLLRLQAIARRGDAEAVRDALQRDLAFWRRMLVTSEILIDRMIAIAGVRQHFNFGNFVLRELPADKVLAAVPPSWQEPITDEERSLWRVLAAEYRFTVRLSNMPDYRQGMLLEDVEDGALDRLMSRMPRLHSTQRDLNHVASVYCRVAEAFSVPLDRYPEVYRELEKSNADRVFSSHTGRYALRHGSIEGMRRAALLTSQLRARSVPASGVAEALEASELRDPFDGKPFTWDARENSVVFEAPEETNYRFGYYY